MSIVKTFKLSELAEYLNTQLEGDSSKEISGIASLSSATSSQISFIVRESFIKELKDRFGEIPLETVELIETLKLREIAKKIGFEKLIIKQGKMVGKFTTTHPSYFESDTFTQILSYIQKNKSGVSLKEKNQKLMMTFENIKSINDANIIVSEILD